LRLCQKDDIFTINSFDIVVVFGNKVECCFDTVAGVDGALYGTTNDAHEIMLSS